MPRLKYPKPFFPLLPAERIIYNRLWATVEDVIGVFDVDNFIITLAAQKLTMSVEALARIRASEETDGLPIQYYENGTAQVSPDYTIFKTQSMEAAKLLRDAGLVPTERLKFLPTEGETPTHDVMAELLGVIAPAKVTAKKN